MARTIELIGVAGVGKTTTYNYMKSIWNSDCKWIPLEFCYSKPPPKKESILKKINRKAELFIPPVVFLGLQKFKAAKPQDVNPHTLSTTSFIEENKQFVDLLWATISKRKNEKNGRDLRHSRLNYAYKMLQRSYNAKKADTDKWCILDEGIIHNISFAIDPTSSSMSYTDQLANALRLIQLPDGIIYFHAEARTIFERVLQRPTATFLDEGLSEEELLDSKIKAVDNKQMCINIIENMGIPVLRVDATESVELKAKKITDFIEQLSPN